MKSYKDIYFIFAFYAYIIYIIILICLYSVKKTDWTLYNEEHLYKHVKTGDIIFFQIDCYESRIYRFFTNCPFSHVGVICKHNNKIYICEAYPSSDKLKDYITNDISDGSRMVLLKDKLNYYKSKWYAGKVKCSILPINKYIEPSDIVKVMKELSELEFANSLTYFINYYLKSQNIHDYDEVLCFEFVTLLYKKLGIIQNDDEIYSPNDIIYYKMKYINNYKNLSLITYNLDYNDNFITKIVRWCISL
jgi:hypothetical protein